MKKNLSTVAELSLMFLMAALILCSCSNDDASSFNPSPVTPSKADTSVKNYTYGATISNDVLSLFDVTITRTIGEISKTYELSNVSDLDQMMSTGVEKFTAEANVKVKVNATFTLKADFQKVLDKTVADKGCMATLNLVVKPNYDFAMMNSKYRVARTTGKETTMFTKDIHEDMLVELAKVYSKMLSVDNTATNK